MTQSSSRLLGYLTGSYLQEAFICKHLDYERMVGPNLAFISVKEETVIIHGPQRHCELCSTWTQFPAPRDLILVVS